MANRLTGKNGTVWINAEPGGLVQRADVFNWEINVSGTPLDCSIKGDRISRFVMSHGTATLTCERYIQTKASFAGFMSTTLLAGTRVTFAVYLIGSNLTYSAVLGQGYITRADVSAPHAKSVDRIEIQIDEMDLTTI